MDDLIWDVELCHHTHPYLQSSIFTIHVRATLALLHVFSSTPRFLQWSLDRLECIIFPGNWKMMRGKGITRFQTCHPSYDIHFLSVKFGLISEFQRKFFFLDAMVAHHLQVCIKRYPGGPEYLWAIMVGPVLIPRTYATKFHDPSDSEIG